MKCKFCEKEVIQPEGKRKKEFCGETCRSNFWYAKNRKGKPRTASAKTPPIVKNKETPPPVVAKNAPPMPKREDFEDNWDYIDAKNNWKKLYNQ